MNTSRRTVVKGLAWTTPVIAVSATAPAFAASAAICTPSGYRRTGKGHNTKDYVLFANCATAQPITGVVIDGVLATELDGDVWILTGRKDSRRTVPVTIRFADGGEWSRLVAFPVAQT